MIRVQAQYTKAIGWEIKGVAYNPTSIGTDQLDPAAPAYDIPQITALGANTISTYNLGRFEWGSYTDLTNGEDFYNGLYPVAETNNLKIIVGYFSNSTIDWTDPIRVAKVTSQYQNLVLKAKDRPSTIMYLLGNEIFEKLASDPQKKAYAQWLGQMTDWTHTNDPNHLVTYGDNAAHAGLEWLKTYVPNLDIYSLNNYEWETYEQLSNILAYDLSAWPGKSLLLHEWGVDSWDVNKWTEDESVKANRITQLADYLKQAYANPNYPFLGGIFFEYNDQWDKIGSANTQDPDHGWPWLCLTCFDHSANEDYWGITRSTVSGQAAGRAKKKAYATLQQAWGGTSNSDTTAPQISITNPANNSFVFPRTKITITAAASDNLGITKVQFYANNSLLCTDLGPPYSCIWTVPKRAASQYTLSAMAYDAAGNNTRAEIVVNVK